ncbi:hypothetical protein [Alkalilimnicola sp. S0819]|uniref:hypothetical protein n=1 Tax=Alkalilimnicola sp. S0819 TaxID=2613922 RepID=UPI0012617B89|nr:hypothetical protein [Alkalilimnicola sp. S0819]KAB7619474.1 hypothetical protein F3N43_13715 [Alkalilimnicola sp. S0819]MPQ17694.1 hypothetical protein [Alkalilimnicola sp. S0819]
MDSGQLVRTFCEAAALAGVSVSPEAITIDDRPAPHEPPRGLPAGKMAVYTFFLSGSCLKVGKVGSKSNARYVSQHYLPNSSSSNLARSLMRHADEFHIEDLEADEVGRWIKENTDRVNFLLDEAAGIPVLNLLEAFLQCALRPRFEGFPSQSSAQQGAGADGPFRAAAQL